jgi:hypothetical protein
MRVNIIHTLKNRLCTRKQILYVFVIITRHYYSTNCVEGVGGGEGEMGKASKLKATGFCVV